MQVSGSGVQLNTPHWLPPAANPPETVQRVWFGFLFVWGFLFAFLFWFGGFFGFFFVPMGEGILLFCFYGDFGGMFAINMSRGGRAGGSEQVSTAQRLACDQLSSGYCRQLWG